MCDIFLLFYQRRINCILFSYCFNTLSYNCISNLQQLLLFLKVHSKVCILNLNVGCSWMPMIVCWHLQPRHTHTHTHKLAIAILYYFVIFIVKLHPQGWQNNTHTQWHTHTHTHTHARTHTHTHTHTHTVTHTHTHTRTYTHTHTHTHTHTLGLGNKKGLNVYDPTHPRCLFSWKHILSASPHTVAQDPQTLVSSPPAPWAWLPTRPLLRRSFSGGHKAENSGRQMQQRFVYQNILNPIR